MLVGYGVFVVGFGYTVWQGRRALRRQRQRRLASAPLEVLLINPYGEDVFLGAEGSVTTTLSSGRT